MNTGTNLLQEQETSSCIRFDKLVEYYLQEKLLRPASAESYRKVVKRWEEETQIFVIDKITRGDVCDWRDKILNRARPETWNTYRRHLRALLNFALQRGYCRNTSNPFSDVAPARTAQRLKKTIDTSTMLTALNLLLRDDCPVEPGWFWAIVVRSIFYTGVRRRQLVGLRWSDIDFQKGTWRLRAETSKTTREWVIPVPFDVIEDLHILYKQTQQRLSRSPQQTEQVFNVTLFYERYRGQEMNGDQIAGFFTRLSKHTNERISAHRLRHTAATMLAPSGDIRALQEMLGHTNISTTMGYIHPDIDNMRALQSHLPSMPSVTRKRSFWLQWQ